MTEKAATKQRWLWLVWLVLTLVVIFWLSYSMLEGDDKQIFMPGPLTSGHHQIGITCSACHKETFSNGEDMQEACVECHGEDRKKPFDSHPRSKFTDPRNAETLENIDARKCVTCHIEHQPDMAGRNGLPQPLDFCFHCHKDICEDRPSHNGMALRKDRKPTGANAR